MRAVVDSNVFIRGRADLDFDELYTTPSVLEELESQRAQAGFEVRDIEVRKPSRDNLDAVVEESERINSPTSETDEELLALAMEVDAVLVTDDLALQNIALRLEVDFESYMGEKIEEKRSWNNVCGNCGNEVSGERCGVCGSTRIRRKPE